MIDEKISNLLLIHWLTLCCAFVFVGSARTLEMVMKSITSAVLVTISGAAWAATGCQVHTAMQI